MTPQISSSSGEIEVLDTIDTIVNFAQTMTYNGVQPVVKLIKKAYQTGVSLTAKQMQKLEERLERLESLPKWFVQIAAMSA